MTEILVIEDDPDSRNLVVYLLEKVGGYTTRAAADGRQGLARVAECPPDLIVCDLQMPHMDGYAVLQALRSAPATERIPVVAVTAASMAGDRERALSAGFNGYLAKPIAPEIFVEEIRKYLPREAAQGDTGG